MKNSQQIAPTGDNRMSDLPMAWELNRDRTINAKQLWNALAEIEAYSEQLADDEPEEEAGA